MQSAAAAIQAAAVALFEAQRASVGTQLQAALGASEKAADDKAKRIQAILDGLDFEGYEAFADIVRVELEALFADGAAVGIAQVGMPGISLDLANTAGVEYAKDRAAEMVGMKWVSGKLAPNPNAQWQIAEGTREMMRSIVTDALEEGFSNERLADALQGVYGFSEARAETIARTETARADVQGSLAGYRAAGIQQKQWLTAPACCDLCQELDGAVVAIDDEFEDPDGGTVDAAPLHPNCRCDCLPVMPETEQETKE